MTTYIVSYDLRQPGRNYEPLYNTLKSFPQWARITESVWAVVTWQNSVQIRDQLLVHMDTNDRVFVIKSGLEAAWSNPLCENQWLRENLS